MDNLLTPTLVQSHQIDQIIISMKNLDVRGSSAITFSPALWRYLAQRATFSMPSLDIALYARVIHDMVDQEQLVIARSYDQETRAMAMAASCGLNYTPKD